jgi:peptide/nickel transport system substrate-binding protein
VATAWTVSKDGKVIEFALRKNVKFHSGDLFTAKDVQFTFDIMRKKSKSALTRLKLVERVEIVNDYNIKIHFKAPDVTFIPERGLAISSKAYFDRAGEEKFSKQPVGTGPYKFVRYVPGQYLDIERFEDYWGEKPQVEKARLHFVAEDTTRLSKLMAGEVDIIQSCPYTSIKSLREDKNFKLVRVPVNHPTMSVVFQMKNPKTPWYDKRVRLAMAYAVDADAIIKNILFGVPNRFAFFEPEALGYDPDLKPYPYSPEKAKALLAEAGYPNGFDFPLYYAETGRVPMNSQVAEAIASYFRAVGLRPKLVGEEWVAYRTRYDEARKNPAAEYVAFFTHGRAGSPEVTNILSTFFTKNGNISVYDNPAFEKILNEAITTMDDTKRAELVKKVVRIIHDDVASFPVYNNVALFAMKKNVNFQPILNYNQDRMYVRHITFE